MKFVMTFVVIVWAFVTLSFFAFPNILEGLPWTAQLLGQVWLFGPPMGFGSWLAVKSFKHI